MEIEEFIKKNLPDRNRFLPMKEEILLLAAKGFSAKQIRDFLAKNRIDVSLRTLQRFIREQVLQKPKNQDRDFASSIPSAKSDDDIGQKTRRQKIIKEAGAPADLSLLLASIREGDELIKKDYR